MRNRRDVPDGHDAEPDRCERLDGRLAAAARALDPDVHPAEAQVHRFPAAVFGGDGGGDFVAAKSGEEFTDQG